MLPVRSARRAYSKRVHSFPTETKLHPDSNRLATLYIVKWQQKADAGWAAAVANSPVLLEGCTEEAECVLWLLKKLIASKDLCCRSQPALAFYTAPGLRTKIFGKCFVLRSTQKLLINSKCQRAAGTQTSRSSAAGTRPVKTPRCRHSAL